MRVSGAALFSLALAAVAGYAVFAAMAWPFKAALFPLVLGIPLAVLALIQLILDLRGAGQAAEPAANASGRRTAGVFAWMAAFIVLVMLAGFPVAVPLFVFSYLVMQSAAGWGLSIALTAAAWGVFHVLFERVLHFPFEAGLIQTWLGI